MIYVTVSSLAYFSIPYNIMELFRLMSTLIYINYITSLFQRSAEAAGRSLVSIIVDHIFLCIKDAG